MKQRGFIALPLMAWGAIAAGAVILGLGIAVKVQTSRLTTSKAETVAVQSKFDAFVAQAKAIGDAQNAKAKAIEVIDKQRKEKADYDNAKAQRDLAGVYAAYRSLRDSRTNPGSGILPPAASGSSDPTRACFDRAGLDSAISTLDRGVAGILGKGDSAIVNLNTARQWAKAK